MQTKMFNACFYPAQEQENDEKAAHQSRPVYLANQSWFAWLTGGSHSAYFHFLDLVELLHPRK